MAQVKYQKKFLNFFVVSFTTVLALVLLSSYFLINMSLNEQRTSELNSLLESNKNRIKDRLQSIFTSLEDTTSNTFIINPLMQFDKKNIKLIDNLSRLKIFGRSGQSTVVTFDYEYLYGNASADKNIIKNILDEKLTSYVKLINVDEKIYRFILPIKFEGHVEGVFIYDLSLDFSDIYTQDYTDYNYSITDNESSLSINSTIIPKDHKQISRKILNDIYLNLHYDEYSFVKEKIYLIGIVFVFVLSVLSIVFYFFYRRGLNEFVAPHEQLLSLQEELIRSHHFRDQLMNSTKLIIISYNKNGMITLFNSTAEEYFGYQESEIVGHRDIFELHMKPIDELTDLKELLVSNDSELKSVDKEWTYKRKDGSSFVGRSMFSKIFDGDNVVGYLDIIEDVTLINIAKEMELSAKKELENSVKAKSEFLANMSHEIRTPMNGVLGMVQLLSETSLSDKQKEMVETVRSCGDSLLSILNDILDLSKIESGKLDLEIIDFNISKLIEEAMFLLSFKVSEKGIDIVFHNEYKFDDLWYRGDITRIKQILVNFLSNAVKFTENGKVEIFLNIKEHSESLDWIEISVKDTGIGISKEAQDNLFTAFTQADSSTTRKFGGTGLGLSICTKLVEIMHGNITVSSELGKGSIFTFKIPLPKGYAIVENSLNNKDLELNEHEILICEDNAVNQKLITLMLKKLGYSCDIAKNGKEGIEMVKSKDYTLVLMDMQMPIMDGITATKEIHSLNLRPRPAIVAMTANAFAEDKQKCFQAGMDDFISKPLELDEVKRILSSF